MLRRIQRLAIRTTALIAFATVQYTLVSNHGYGAGAADTDAWTQWSLIPLAGNVRTVAWKVDSVLLQPLKAAVDSSFERDIGSGHEPSFLGRMWIWPLLDRGRIRAFHVTFAALNTSLWWLLAELTLLGFRRLRPFSRHPIDHDP